ncbi:MAG: hypothetical protein KKH41_03380 [Candidatus Thermoplasmatota archaeon]|nr:hypothetical protein [Euryarchaeota archaeon]MBU4031877.1 hypothetical protein [Candidatus Thermoplasmatota archaeon]MBU4143823.1 hypothetical protein [Candidatus Thermoplasmatota archaeon]MBU4591608.1 hypothetical protein [Candidatus Thermoplasmatota archaeon]
MKTKIIFIQIICLLIFTSIFHNASAVDRIYTIDDDGADITICVGQKFNVSVHWSSVKLWLLEGYDLNGDGGYDSSVLEVVDGGFWQPVGEWYGPTFNLTFEGINAGNETIIYNYRWLSNNSIEDSFTLNVTVVESNQSVNLPLMLIVIIIIAVVPSAILIKRMKGGKNDDKKLS